MRKAVTGETRALIRMRSVRKAMCSVQPCPLQLSFGHRTFQPLRSYSASVSKATEEVSMYTGRLYRGIAQ